jgi:hypothetical protein
MLARRRGLLTAEPGCHAPIMDFNPPTCGCHRFRIAAGLPKNLTNSIYSVSTEERIDTDSFVFLKYNHHP